MTPSTLTSYSVGDSFFILSADIPPFIYIKNSRLRENPNSKLCKGMRTRLWLVSKYNKVFYKFKKWIRNNWQRNNVSGSLIANSKIDIHTNVKISFYKTSVFRWNILFSKESVKKRLYLFIYIFNWRLTLFYSIKKLLKKKN